MLRRTSAAGGGAVAKAGGDGDRGRERPPDRARADGVVEVAVTVLLLEHLGPRGHVPVVARRVVDERRLHLSRLRLDGGIGQDRDLLLRGDAVDRARGERHPDGERGGEEHRAERQQTRAEGLLRRAGAGRAGADRGATELATTAADRRPPARAEDCASACRSSSRSSRRVIGAPPAGASTGLRWLAPESPRRSSPRGSSSDRSSRSGGTVMRGSPRRTAHGGACGRQASVGNRTRGLHDGNEKATTGPLRPANSQG